ncbi:globin [Onchocerca flexuosa]|uniref:Globin n=1 Tax=Onchocerca flexuosa TaxID=387005 RepID=A0A238BTY6_9BILA|nr:globin [Onchocerca flexuosa]
MSHILIIKLLFLEMKEGFRNIHEDDKNLLRESWCTIYQNLQKIGVNIFNMIFEQCPEAKFLFPFTDTSRKDSDFIKFHSLRFLQAIESVIKSLDNLSEIDPLLTNLGHVHGRLKKRVDFKPEYWNIFRECTLYHFRRAFEKNNIIIRTRRLFGMSESKEMNVDYLITLWSLLLDYLIEEMTMSFRADVRTRELNKNNWLQNEDEQNNDENRR